MRRAQRFGQLRQNGIVSCLDRDGFE